MEDLKLAILIDADNISPKYVKVILDEAANFGVAACKRIYGDWSDARLKSWKDALLNNSIIPIQQYSYTTGKNATDSAMIIDAMDILYTGQCDGFVLVSSDSDFTLSAVDFMVGAAACEMPATWPDDALLAQMVASRSYALYLSAQGQSFTANSALCSGSTAVGCGSGGRGSAASVPFGSAQSRSAALFGASASNGDSISTKKSAS